MLPVTLQCTEWLPVQQRLNQPNVNSVEVEKLILGRLRVLPGISLSSATGYDSIMLPLNIILARTNFTSPLNAFSAGPHLLLNKMINGPLLVCGSAAKLCYIKSKS